MTNTRKAIQKSFLGILILLVVIQFIRPAQNNQPDESKKDIKYAVKVPDNINLVLRAACYDCHSNHTEYPWYAEIMPIGYWLSHHVEEGKEHLNFSEFATYSAKKQYHKLEEIAEEVGEKGMPLSSYIIVHKKSKLTDEQIAQLQEWVDGARKEINYLDEN